jgi:hypothetical protein
MGYRDPNRSRRDTRGEDFYYGGRRAQREDWERRAFDNNDFDRREGMYDAGGRDLDDRWREDVPPFERRERGWWSEHNPMSGERPWYEGDRPRRFIGGDRGWAERRDSGRQESRARGGFVEGVKNFFGVGPKGYKRSDERIREDVCEALASHPDIDASEIEVRVKDGHVILTGTVENRWMRRQAEDAIEFVPGVTDIRDELTIPRNTDTNGELSSRPRNRKVQ